jgi:nicotinamide-nucleotide amidase
MGAEIFSVGTERLLGQIVDTNAAFLAQRLSQLGIDCFHKTTVGDNPTRLVAALRVSLTRSDLIITTGGLGPTEDDVSAAAVAQVMGVELALHEPSAEAIKRLLAARGLPLLPSHLKQAQVPAGCKVLPNPIGTAPGFILEKKGRTLLSLPGPQVEMKVMFEESVRPYLEKYPGRGGIIQSRLLRFLGLPESSLEEELKDLFHAQVNPTLAPLVGHGEVRLRITAKAADEAAARALIEPVEREVRRRLQPFIVGADEEDVEATVGRLLKEKGLTLAVAESCTGGLIAHRLTEIAGASNYFLASLVCYGNPAKAALLGVEQESLNKYGAVSEPVALEMARGARGVVGADVGISDTGIAGPTGGAKDKPVGLVYVALSTHEKETCVEHHFRGDRQLIKNQAASAALNLLRKALEGSLPGFFAD